MTKRSRKLVKFEDTLFYRKQNNLITKFNKKLKRAHLDKTLPKGKRSKLSIR